MTRAVLNEPMQTTLGPIVPTGTQFNVWEMDGVTPIAQTMWNAASGGTSLGNPLQTDGSGYLTAYVTTPQRCLLQAASGGPPRLAEFRPDWASVTTLDGAQTLQNKTFENLDTPLVDLWASDLVAAPGVGYGKLALSQGSPSFPNTRGYPMVYLESRIAPNQSPLGQLPADIYLHSESGGALLKALGATTGTSGSLTFVDTAASFSMNQYDDCQITVIRSGDLVHAMSRRITGTTNSTTLAIDYAWDNYTPTTDDQYVINRGGVSQKVGLLINALSNSKAKPYNFPGLEHIGLMIYARKNLTPGDLTILSPAGMYAALFYASASNALNHTFGLEIDADNPSGVDAAADVQSAVNSTVNLNLAGFGNNHNTVAVYVQAGPLASYFRGFNFSQNSIANYTANATARLATGIAFDFEQLAEGTTTPRLIRAGSGHVILLGRNAANTADVDLVKWVSDILSIQADTIKMNNAAGTNYGQWDSTGLTIAGSGKRIISNFTAGSPSGRVLFAPSATPGAPLVGVVPTGTATIAGWVAHGGSDPDNAAMLQLYVDGATATYLDSNKTGTGTYRPLRLKTSATDQIEVTTAGLWNYLNGQVVTAAGGSAGLNNKTGDGSTTGPASLTATKWLKIQIAGTVGWISVHQ